MSAFIINGFGAIPFQVRDELISHYALPGAGVSVSEMRGSLEDINNSDCLVKIQRALPYLANGRKEPRWAQRCINMTFHNVVDTNIQSGDALFSLFVQRRCFRSDSIRKRIVEDISTTAFKDSPANIDFPVSTVCDIHQDCVFCIEHKTREEEPLIPCENCHGSGFIKCERCEGTGREQYVAGNYASGEDIIRTGACPECEGTGKIPCPACGGNGHIEIYAPTYSVIHSVDEVIYHEIVAACWSPWSSSILFTKNSLKAKQKAQNNSEYEYLGINTQLSKKEKERIGAIVNEIKNEESVCYKNRQVSSKDLRPTIIEDMDKLGFEEAYETNSKLCEDHFKDHSLLINQYEQHFIIPMKRLTLTTSSGKAHDLFIYEAGDGVLHISLKRNWSFVSGWRYFFHKVYFSLVLLGRAVYKLVVKS